MYSDLRGKNILITGASSGIGQAIAIEFARQGANIGINYAHSEEGAKETKEKIDKLKSGVKTVILPADVSVESEVVYMIESFEKKLGPLDGLINNAGIQQASPSQEVTMQDFQKVIDVNLIGAFLCSQQAIRSFIHHNISGTILFISSVHQIIPKPEYLSYSVSKGGIQNLTRTLALEYADRGIRINAIGPGAVITPINDAWINDPEKKKAVESHIPMKRAAKSSEIATVATFLSSNQASYITGQTLFVDGGLTLFPDFKNDRSSGGNT